MHLGWKQKKNEKASVIKKYARFPQYFYEVIDRMEVANPKFKAGHHYTFTFITKHTQMKRGRL